MFKKATKTGQHARIAMFGPAGSGKTYSALKIGRGLAGENGRIAVIDTERGSASKYADVEAFDVCELATFAPAEYIGALRGAAGEGYAVVVVDSLSHAWEGDGGILDQVDRRGGRFDAWKEMTPQTRELVDMLITYPGHVIVTMRSKTEYVVEKNEKGKSEPRKIGLAPRFKDGMEYEFDIVLEMDDANVARVSKSRCVGLSGKSIPKPGAALAREVLAWLGSAPPREAARAVSRPATVPASTVDEHGEFVDPEQARAPNAPPERFGDCVEADQLRAFCSKHRAALSQYRNGQRKNAQAKCDEAASRCGVDPAIARAWAGLADGDEVRG